MPDVVFPLDSTKKFTEQKYLGHNRWHPDIPTEVTVRPGESFRVHCREWFDGAIHNDDSADDVRDAPLSTVHVLSGPIRVEGAQPGDLLVVDILDLGPIPQEDSGPLAGQGWGYTGIFAIQNGGGFLTEQFPDAYKVIWDFSGQTATSRHIPGVSFTGIVHPGLMGTAPSAFQAARDRTTGAGYRCVNGRQYGNGLVSRWPTGSAGGGGIHPAQDPDDPEERSWVCRDVAAPSVLSVCTTHLAYTVREVALAQCAHLSGTVVPELRARTGGAPVVLGADLNLGAGGPELDACLPAGHTRAGDGGPQHVVATPGLVVADHRTIDLDGSTDHPGLLVTLVPG